MNNNRPENKKSDYISRVQVALMQLHNYGATWRETVPVHEVFRGQTVWQASRIARELNAEGGRLGENDNWIAATARAWGFRLISRDNAFSR
ncbi:MAG: PIN domain-containing protein, partial [Limisphaerales bacterium]